ncbi:GNAT family N-acetyltransferase [Achromobacter marplatensis]|uniref:GNAT family N-acetyltransferase n=1 Tax=Achromobacter marplatensis TaxID=470868 RepID=UPI003D00FD44
MSDPSIAELFTALEATWPPASTKRVGPWKIRNGCGGGQRVSSTTAEALVVVSDIALAEDAMSGLHQNRIFMIRPGMEQIDALLERQGYRIKDSVVVYLADVPQLATEPLPHASVFEIYPPLGIMAELWMAGGIGPDRLAVMERVQGPKTALLVRCEDFPAGVAFVAAYQRIAVIHAIHVTAALRRKGVGTNIIRASARWAQGRGATHLALAATRTNTDGRALYTSNGMKVLAEYHYRTK